MGIRLFQSFLIMLLLRLKASPREAPKRIPRLFLQELPTCVPRVIPSCHTRYNQLQTEQEEASQLYSKLAQIFPSRQEW